MGGLNMTSVDLKQLADLTLVDPTFMVMDMTTLGLNMTLVDLKQLADLTLVDLTFMVMDDYFGSEYDFSGSEAAGRSDFSGSDFYGYGYDYFGSEFDVSGSGFSGSAAG